LEKDKYTRSHINQLRLLENRTDKKRLRTERIKTFAKK